jgi:hypothetical protein
MSQKAKIIYRNAARDMRKQIVEALRSCVRKVNKTGCTPLQPGNEYPAAVELLAIHLEGELETVFKRYRSRQSSYEPLFSMPPARRAKVVATAKPVTLVERRAAAAKRKVREWQRKSKLASTKIKQYRKKVSYYTKKGVIR